MTTGWWAALLAVGLVAWSGAIGVRIEKQTLNRLRLASRGDPGLAIAVTIGFHFLIAAVGIPLMLLASRMHEPGLAVAVVVVTVLITGPWIFVCLSSDRGWGFEDPMRRDLEAMGASRDVGRAIAWTGQPLAAMELFGLGVCFVEIVL